MPGEPNDYNNLKEELSKMGQWVSYFQKKQNHLEQRISTLENTLSVTPSSPVEKIIEQKTETYPYSTTTQNEEIKTNSGQKTLGVITIILGVLVSLGFFSNFEFIYLFLGLTLMVLGSLLLSRKNTGTKTITNISSETIQTEEKSEMTEEKKSLTFEEDIGMKWFARVGILALVIGVGFFIKYAIDMNWINHLTRIILGIVFGSGLIVFGEIISKKEQYLNWGKTLVGGGIAIIYFVVYAAYHFPEYRLDIGISQTTDIFLLTLVVLLAIYLSIKDNSQITVAGAFFLGYVTSFLSNNFEMTTLVYNLLLSVGLVTVVAYKKWPVIGVSGIIASYLMHTVWLSDNNNSTFVMSFLPLIIYFLAFTLQSFFIAKKENLFKQNTLMILLNSILFFLIAFNRVDHYYPEHTGLLTIIVSAFHFISYYLYQTKIDNKIASVQLYLALFYLTLAVFIQLDPKLVTFFWALEALLLTSLAFKFRSETLKVSSFVVGLATTFKAVLYDTTSLQAFDSANILNSTRMLSLLFTVLCFYIIYKIFETNQEILGDDDIKISKTYSWVASGLLILTIILEFSDKYPFFVTVVFALLALAYLFLSKIGKRTAFAQSVVIFGLLALKIILLDSRNLNSFQIENFFSSTRFFSFLIGIATFYISSYYLEIKKSLLIMSEKNLPIIYSYTGTLLAFILIMIEMKEFWISVGWSVLALVVLGVAYRKKFLRLQGMLLLSITILKVFIYDTRGLETIYRTVSYMVLGMILLLVSFIYTKYKEKLKEII